jgi:ABC-type uncharacterized transport system fused permease/ATPase subunit
MFLLLFVIRAFLNVQRSRADGSVIDSLIQNQGQKKALLSFLAVSLLSVATSGFIEHLRFYLIATYRERITLYFQKQYFDKYTYYYGTVLDDRIKSADTAITNYCHEFAEHFAELPYYFLLPLCEATISLYVVYREIGRGPAAALTTTVFLSLGVLQSLTPPFGKIHAFLLSREDDFKRLHHEVSSNVEQIAFHNAGSFVRQRLENALGKVLLTMRHMALAKGHFQLLEMTMSSCVWDAAGFLACGKLLRNEGRSTNSDLVTSIVVHRRVIGDFHSAVKALIVNIKEVSHLSEFTEKLAQFDQVLDSIARVELQGVHVGEEFHGRKILHYEFQLMDK